MGQVRTPNKLLLRTVSPLLGLRMADAIIAQSNQLQACRRARRYVDRSNLILMEEKIRAVNWDKYNGPEFYDQESVIESLIHLSKNDVSMAPEGLDNKVHSALGNNHAGTYYPAILEAADLLIEIEMKSNSKRVRKCAYAILNNLYYFRAEVGSYTGHSIEEVEAFVHNKLAPYADPT